MGGAGGQLDGIPSTKALCREHAQHTRQMRTGLSGVVAGARGEGAGLGHAKALQAPAKQGLLMVVRNNFQILCFCYCIQARRVSLEWKLDFYFIGGTLLALTLACAVTPGPVWALLFLWGGVCLFFVSSLDSAFFHFYTLCVCLPCAYCKYKAPGSLGSWHLSIAEPVHKQKHQKRVEVFQ